MGKVVSSSRPRTNRRRRNHKLNHRPSRQGQTTDQVQSALGKPDKIVNLGSRQIYVYKDLKVTFVNGKVSDVQ